VPLALRLIACAVLALAGLTLLTVGVLGARSRLRRNRWIGIRTDATLRSDAAFTLGHRVGAVPALAAGTVAVIGAAVLLAGADGAERPGGAALSWTVLAVSAIGSLGLACFAGLVGDRAAANLPASPPAGQQACAGACAGCDLVAGCRDRTPPVAGDYQPQEPGIPLNGPTTSSVTQPP
jgi:SdpI/YfhL protein family